MQWCNSYSNKCKKLKEVREEWGVHSDKTFKNNHDLPLFHKFDTNILITMKYHTIISYVDADTQAAYKNKILNNFDPITLLSIIICSKSLYMEIHLDPTDFLSKRFPLVKCSIGQISTSYYE